MIDLNKAKGRVTIEILLADKTFRISRVVTGVRQMYSGWMARTAEALEKVDQLGIADGESPEEYQARVERVTKEIEEFADHKRDIYFRMLELILTKNDYEMDRKWWEENTDEIDQQKFLEACLTKDAPAQKKTMTGKGSTTKS